MRSVLALVAASALLTPCAALAGKPWTPERVASCTKSLSDGDLDPDEGFTTGPCRRSSTITKDSGSPTEASIDPMFVALRGKGAADWGWALAFNVEYKRITTAITSAGNGRLDLSRITFRLDGRLVEAQLVTTAAAFEGCYTGGQGAMSFSSCSWHEISTMVLTPELLSGFRAAYTSGAADLAVRMQNDRGDVYEASVPLVELIGLEEKAR